MTSKVDEDSGIRFVAVRKVADWVKLHDVSLLMTSKVDENGGKGFVAVGKVADWKKLHVPLSTLREEEKPLR